jgi:hypothetical protein
MTNRDLDAAWSYHDGTKHSYDSIHSDAHYLDWENHPLPFKIYQTLEPVALPQALLASGVPALSAVSASNPPVAASSIPSLSMPLLASLLYFSAGITKRKQYPGGEILFRAAACTGALYHIECIWFAETYRSCRQENHFDQGTSPPVLAPGRLSPTQAGHRW